MRQHTFLIVPVLAAVLATASVVNGGEPASQPSTGGTGEVRLPFVLPAGNELERGIERFQPRLNETPSLESDQPLAARLEALAREIPETRYDLKAGADALPDEVDAVFAFVRDQIRYEAYSGVLRGAEHTYVNRAGNAWDRSLLLAEILKRKGVGTRFVLGRLPREECERLFARIFDPSAPSPEESASQDARSQATPDESFQARVRNRAVRDYALIRAALGDDIPAHASPVRDDVLKEIESHAWIQAQVNGKWVDLDSSFGDAAPGRSYGVVERVCDELPMDVHQQVTIRVVVETLAGEESKSQPVLEVTKTAAELLDRQVFLVHGPQSGGLGGAIDAAIAGAEGGELWDPLLWIDGEFHRGKSISFTDEDKKVERGKPPKGGLSGVFGKDGALGASQQFVAEWLELEIRFPDGRTDVSRRALEDRAGMAWRATETPTAADLRPLPREGEALTSPRAVHNIWFSAGRHNLAAYTDSVRQFAQALQKDDAEFEEVAMSEIPFAAHVWPFAIQNFAFLVVSDHLIAPSLNDSPAHRFYADSPRIYIVTAGPDPREEEGGTYLLGDLRRDHLRGLARTKSGESGVIQRKIWFGVLEGAFEHEMGQVYLGLSAHELKDLLSTSNLVGDDGLTLLRATDAARVNELIEDRETAARIALALKDGDILAVPAAVFRGEGAGWWEVAGDGETRSVANEDVNPWGVPIGPGHGWRADQIGPKMRFRTPSGSHLGKNPDRPAATEYVAMLAFVSDAVIAAGTGFVGAYAWEWGERLGERVHDYLNAAIRAPDSASH